MRPILKVYIGIEDELLLLLWTDLDRADLKYSLKILKK